MARQGFFNLGPLAAPVTSGKSSRGSFSSGTGCEACQRYHHCASPKLPVTGEGKKKILVVIEVPSARDDDKGVLLSGDSGAVLREALEDAGLSLKDCWVTAAARCFGKKEPTGIEVEHCRPLLLQTIQDLQPTSILALGVLAVQAIIGDRWQGRLENTKPSSLFGVTYPDREFKAWVTSSYSIQQMVGADRKRDLKLIFRNHLRGMKARMGTPFPEIPEDFRCITKVDEAQDALREIIRTAKWIAFDYETTGIKPHRDGHKIVTASVAWRTPEGKLTAVAFPWFQDLIFLDLWRKLMSREAIGKVAHNNAFEDTWTYWRAGAIGVPRYWVRGWKSDTCLGAHCLANTGPTSLKWEVFTRLGVLGYDAAIDPYLKSPKKDGANGFNRMASVTPMIILPYNAKDSLYSYWLAEQQEAELSEHQKVGLDFFTQAGAALAKVSSNGFPLDPERTQKTYQDLTIDLNKTARELAEFPEYKAMGSGFNPGSDKQLASCLYDKMGHPIGPNGRSVDEEALELIGGPFVEKVLHERKIKKLRDTYLSGFQLESVGGILRPFFNLQKVDTFRSSSSNPNFQNVPKRDKYAQRIIRSVFRPSKGNRIIEWDYKAVEVCISACYHKDPMMIKYIEDPTTDMHRDTAFGLFLRTQEDFTKDERGIAKNGFVFPSFYGSIGENMAHGIWVMLPESTKEHLRANGIKNEKDFTAHVVAYEREFWEVRFRTYNQWRNDIWASYQRCGYIDLLTGFRMHGPLKKTQATNGQIQGSAFHCLLRTLTKAAPEIEAISGRSRIVGQIHDAMVGDIHPEDEAEADRIIKHYGVTEIREAWPWIIVPLTIEKDRSEVDGSWADMKGCGTL